MEYSRKNVRKIDTISIPREENFKSIEHPKKIEYLICDKYGYGIQTVILADEREPLTCFPSYVGKTNYSFILENVSPSGAYEAEVVGRIPSDFVDEGYNICLSIPNLIRNNYWKANQYYQFTVNCSGVFEVAEVSKFKPRIIERKEPNGSMEKMDMGRVGLLFPRQPENPFYPYYYVRGEIIEFQRFKNNVTKIPMVWMCVDTKLTKIEIIGNENYLQGDVQNGNKLSAYVWLQGQIVNYNIK